MNRPELKNLLAKGMTHEEINELEKYCDELEKALDKACKFIDDIHSCPLDSFDFEVEGGCDGVCLERTEDSSLCWKEWCLRDE